MEHLVSEILTGASGAGAYGLVLLVLLLCGVGVPLPEDVALITGGYLVYSGAARLDLMIVVAFAGILGGDSFAFLLGRHLGDRLTRTWPIRLIVTPAKRKKVEKLFAHYGEKIVLAARFMPGVRAVTYFCGGAAGMSYPRFILFDGLAATISAPVFVLLGWHFGNKIDWLVKAVRRGQGAVLGTIVGIVVVSLLVRHLRRRPEAEEPKKPDVQPPLSPQKNPDVLPPQQGESEVRVAK